MKLEDLKGINAVWLSETGLTNLNSGEGGSNLIDIKRYKKMGIEYPYVSGQAMRYYFKESIRRNLDENHKFCRPNALGETCSNIEECVGCDLFGFFSAVKGKGALTRLSPVKISPATGLLPFEENSVLDFLTRRKPQEAAEEKAGDIVNVEIGTNIYKCGMAIDVVRVGHEETWTTKDALKPVVKAEERIERMKLMLDSLRFITDYSKQSRLLTDFTPDVLCLAFQTRYSYRLQKLLEFRERDSINEERVRQILKSVEEYTPKIWFGTISNTFSNEEAIKKIFEENNIPVLTPKEVVKSAITELSSFQ